MEQTRIAPPGLAPALLGVIPLPEASLALFTLREPHREFFTLSRTELGDTVEALIAILDATEDDPDLEPNGDELDGSGAEDDFGGHNVPGHLQGPGCPIADPDMAADDIECDDIDQDLELEDYIEDEFSDPAVRARHRRRIQRTRCIPRYRVRRHSLTGEIMSREVARYELGGRGQVPARQPLLKRKRGMPQRPRP